MKWGVFFISFTNKVEIQLYFSKVVQIYIQTSLNLNFTVPHPLISLVAYERISLDVNSQVTLTFKITPEQLSVYYPDDSVFFVYPSKFKNVIKSNTCARLNKIGIQL